MVRCQNLLRCRADRRKQILLHCGANVCVGMGLQSQRLQAAALSSGAQKPQVFFKNGEFPNWKPKRT
jgi:hypothetical protein